MVRIARMVALACFVSLVVGVGPASADFTDHFTNSSDAGLPLVGEGAAIPWQGSPQGRIVNSTNNTEYLGADWGNMTSPPSGLDDVAYIDGLHEGGIVKFQLQVQAFTHTQYDGSSPQNPNIDWWSMTLYTDPTTYTAIMMLTGRSDRITFWGPTTHWTVPIPVDNMRHQIEIDISFPTGGGGGTNTIRYSLDGLRPNPGPPVPLWDDTFTTSGNNEIEQVEFKSYGHTIVGEFGGFPNEGFYFDELVIDSTVNQDGQGGGILNGPPGPSAPEPATMALLAVGGVGLAGATVRRRRAS